MTNDQRPTTNDRRPTTRAACIVLVVAFTSLTCVRTVQAADESGKPTVAARTATNAPTENGTATVEPNSGETRASATEAPTVAPGLVPLLPHRSPSTRPLVPLYVSYAALQAFDVHSTLRALDAGGIEGNAIVAPFISRPAAFVALKAGATAGIIYASQRLAKRNRVGAFVLMVAANAGYALIVAHNYRVASQLR